MVKIQCQDCKRVVEVPKEWDASATCDDCGGDLKEISIQELIDGDKIEKPNKKNIEVEEESGF